MSDRTKHRTAKLEAKALIPKITSSMASSKGTLDKQCFGSMVAADLDGHIIFLLVSYSMK